MAIQLSTAVRNAGLDAYETSVGTSAVLKIRTGTPPANCAGSDSGTVVISYSLASDWWANASAGAKAFSNLPLTGTASNTGTPGHFRVYASDGVTCGIQGTVTFTGSGGDMTIDAAGSVTSGQTVNVTGFTLSAGNP
jgi:hypothetical protein